MKKRANRIVRCIGNFVFSLALFSTYLGHPHCLLIIHQPRIPDKLNRLVDEENENSTSSLHLIVIDELYDCQSPELGIRFEYALNRLDGNADVLIIAATKLSSADIITEIIQHAFPYRITSMQSSALSSKIFIGEEYAAYIENDELIIKGFEDDLLLCNLEPDEKVLKKNGGEFHHSCKSRKNPERAHLCIQGSRKMIGLTKKQVLSIYKLLVEKTGDRPG